MQETLHDGQGNAVAYIDFDDENTVYLWDGSPVAYLSSENRLYGFNGKHLGWYEDGIVWDHSGRRNGYNAQALSVFAKFEPFKAFKKFKPFKSFEEFAKFKPFKTGTVSPDTLQSYLQYGAK